MSAKSFCHPELACRRQAQRGICFFEFMGNVVCFFTGGTMNGIDEGFATNRAKPQNIRPSYFPYRNASRVFRRSAASRNRRRSSAVFKISGGTVFGFLVCSSIATNVT